MGVLDVREEAAAPSIEGATEVGVRDGEVVREEVGSPGEGQAAAGAVAATEEEVDARVESGVDDRRDPAGGGAGDLDRERGVAVEFRCPNELGGRGGMFFKLLPDEDVIPAGATIQVHCHGCKRALRGTEDGVGLIAVVHEYDLSGRLVDTLYLKSGV